MFFPNDVAYLRLASIAKPSNCQIDLIIWIRLLPANQTAPISIGFSENEVAAFEPNLSR